jgi:hypothetical protein
MVTAREGLARHVESRSGSGPPDSTKLHDVFVPPSTLTTQLP